MEEEILDDLNRELEDVINEGKEILEEASLSDRLQDFKSDVELLIRKRPFESVLAGFTVGYLISKLFNSNK